MLQGELSRLAFFVTYCGFFGADHSPIKGLSDSISKTPASSPKFYCAGREPLASLPMRFTSPIGEIAIKAESIGRIWDSIHPPVRFTLNGTPSV